MGKPKALAQMSASKAPDHKLRTEQKTFYWLKRDKFIKLKEEKRRKNNNNKKFETKPLPDHNSLE